MGYCTRDDVFRWLPRGGVTNPARHVSHVNTSANSLVVNGHGFRSNDLVSFRSEAGGVLPAPLSEGVSYYVIPLSESAFAVAESPGGLPVDIETTGNNTFVISELPWEAWIEEATSWLECTMPAHIVPLSSPYPAIVIRYTAGIVAEMAMAHIGVSSEAIAAQLERIRGELAIWRKGASIRGPIEPPQAQVPLLWVDKKSPGRTLP